MSFEFSKTVNRIKGALSCAKALALVFGAPLLREAKFDTFSPLRLLNMLCRPSSRLELAT